MAVSTVSPPQAIVAPFRRPQTVAGRRWRITSDVYHRMIEAGIVTTDDPVELIRGEIVEMPGMGGPHIDCSGTLNRLLVKQVGDDVRVHAQLPVRLPNDSEPEPDFSLVRASYDRSHAPDVTDVFVVIEVSDSSRRYDRTVKLPLYAEAGIPEAWQFDVIERRITRHTDPTPAGYATVDPVAPGQTLASTVLAAVRISYDAIFGPPPQPAATAQALPED